MPSGQPGWSRDPEDLLPDVQVIHASWVQACQARGVQVLTYCTWRSAVAQAALYAIGRTQPGKDARGRSGFGRGFYVTMAQPWESEHQYRMAWDAVPLLGGKPDWSYADLDRDGTPDERHWMVMAEEADRLGIGWAGRWERFREYVHWSHSAGLDRSTLRAMALSFGQDRGQVA